MFDVNDLKPGMYVKLKNGREGILLYYDNRLTVYSISNYSSATKRVTSELRSYNDSIMDKIDKDFSIVEVYSENMTNGHEIFSIVGRELLWSYAEHVEELTVAEIEERLGYKIKIVK